MSNEHAVCLPSSQQTFCLGDNHSILSHTTRSAQVRPRLVGLRNRTRHSSYCSPNARNMVWRISLLLAKQRYRIDYGRSSPKTCIHCVTVHGICVKLMRNTKPTVKTQNFVNRDRDNLDPTTTLMCRFLMLKHNAEQHASDLWDMLSDDHFQNR